MAKGYASAGVDFDELFDPDVMGDGPAAAGISSNGTPLRYAALQYGTKRADVGYRVNGADVSNLWAAKGTAAYTISGLNGKHLQATEQAFTNQGNVHAQVSLGIHADGTWSVNGGTSQGPFPQPAPTTGTWLPPGASVSDFEVWFEASVAGWGTAVFNNGAPGYVAVAGGRGCSLSLPAAPAGNAMEREATASVVIRLRRISTGVVTNTSVTMRVETTGYA